MRPVSLVLVSTYLSIPPLMQRLLAIKGEIKEYINDKRKTNQFGSLCVTLWCLIVLFATVHIMTSCPFIKSY